MLELSFSQRENSELIFRIYFIKFLNTAILKKCSDILPYLNILDYLFLRLLDIRKNIIIK